MAGPYAARFLKQETSDDTDFDLPSFHCFEGGVGEKRIESLLGLDTRLSQVDRDFLLRFFESRGLAEVADLQDVGALRPLPDYLRTSLEAYQKEQGYEAAKSGAVWATLGRLLKRLEEEAPSKGAGKGNKSRYRTHLSNRSGPCGRPKGRGQSRSPRNGGRSWAGSRQRRPPRDQQRQQQEPALWMAARAGDTEQCQQLLAARAEVDVRLKSWDLLSLVTTLERQKPSAWRLEAPWQPTKMQWLFRVRPLIHIDMGKAAQTELVKSGYT